MKNKLFGLFICILLFSSLSTSLVIADDPSSIKVNQPSGPTIGVVGVEFIICYTLPNETECEPYYIYWDFGDGTYSEWMGPYPAGETVCVSHDWSEPGIYEIRVKIRDNCGNEYWTEPWVIIIPPMTELDIKIMSVGLLKINVVINNIGEVDAYNISWNINITGNIFIGKETAGSFSKPLPPGEQQTVCSSLFLGFGLIKITASARALNAEEVTDELGGFVFLFFFIPRIHYLK